MDMYGIPAPESFRIDDLLDFSNSELFSSSNAGADQSSDLYPHFPSSFTQSSNINLPIKTHITDFTDDLYVPNEEVAELEWLSNFVDDSFTDFTTNELANVVNLQQPEVNTTFHSRSRSKRSRATSSNNINGWIIPTESNASGTGARKRDNNAAEQQDIARRCTHCASEKTPQWRTGPLGPKTLCNACGVRYKSGRLVPEYRPAASPTFVLTQHSNSHRKVMELRRQKEIVKQEHEHGQQLFHHHHVHQYHQQQQRTQQKNFEVC